MSDTLDPVHYVISTSITIFKSLRACLKNILTFWSVYYFVFHLMHIFAYLDFVWAKYHFYI